MHKRAKLLAALVGLFVVSTTQAALKLDDLSVPTLQTLINQGSSGVVVGDLRFYDFSYLGGGSSPLFASSIAVRSNGNGIDFVGGWGAMDGDFTSGIFSWKVTAAGLSGSVDDIAIFSDALALSPASGTYASVTQAIRDAGGNLLGQPIASFNDGVDSPVDNTQPDNSFDSLAFSPQAFVSVTTSLQVKSGVGGLSQITYFTASGGFNPITVTVPEPSTVAGLASVVASFWIMRRKPTRHQ